ncbi:MAG: dihydroorotate dehydrogenase electron transfer subunit [Candidatus Improbicoccus pseudotrichonymphae]|uniref:Dihydroorotate dehydrogenase electron transfer subunit n=1 Tax=Candidatus Improbicoccus pseudotrichonymphae TaxID=3033792 RepID=A0AA48HYC0_9FIRM|nr:MAG: dihydroorotate dehydrogenase electron transfer subunit [Candidatus Improbicoccus pseudotrichonymphae]
MKIKQVFKIKKNSQIAQGIFSMIIYGNIASEPIPGQFLNIKINDFYLRRPFGFCDVDLNKNEITLIYKVCGAGTLKLSGMKKGEDLDVLYNLGNGFDLKTIDANSKIVLISGGVGLPPIYFLAKYLQENNFIFKRIDIVTGFKNFDQSFYIKEISKFGNVHVVSEDGSVGEYKGYVTNVLERIDYDYYFACGPLPMLKSVFYLGKSGQLSMEEKMACGFGACMGCCTKTNVGMKRLCVEGPVLKSEEVIFD